MSKHRHSAKYIFAECQKKTLGKDVFCRVFLFAECIFLALGKHGLCRVPDKIHSAKPSTLGKSPVSGSEPPRGPTLIHAPSHPPAPPRPPQPPPRPPPPLSRPRRRIAAAGEPRPRARVRPRPRTTASFFEDGAADARAGQGSRIRAPQGPNPGVRSLGLEVLLLGIGLGEGWLSAAADAG